jgi:hypothetical protein
VALLQAAYALPPLSSFRLHRADNVHYAKLTAGEAI